MMTETLGPAVPRHNCAALSKISIAIETEHSRSRSVAASLIADDSLTPELYYLYFNEPYPTAPGHHEHAPRNGRPQAQGLSAQG